MKKVLILFTILIIVVSGLMSGCIKEGEGTLILQITDDPSDLNITEALVTMSQVRVHFAGIDENNTTGEWIPVVNDSQTFDLILLQDVKELFGTAELNAGWYTQIRLQVDSALVTIDGIQYDLEIPSKAVKLIKPFRILDGQTTTLTLDFDVHNSVHVTGSDKYILRPTIKVIQE
jgi:hypothetical protein